MPASIPPENFAIVREALIGPVGRLDALAPMSEVGLASTEPVDSVAGGVGDEESSVVV